MQPPAAQFSNFAKLSDESNADRRCNLSNAKAIQQASTMHFDGTHADAKLVSDRLARLSKRQRIENLSLTPAQHG